MLRLSRKTGKRIDLSEGAWLDVKADLSKRDFLHLMESLPESAQQEAAAQGGEARFKIAEAFDFQKALFEVLVVAWSIEEVAPSVEAYLDLERGASDEVDRVLMEYFTSLMPTKDESGKRSTSRASLRRG